MLLLTVLLDSSASTGTEEDCPCSLQSAFSSPWDTVARRFLSSHRCFSVKQTRTEVREHTTRNTTSMTDTRTIACMGTDGDSDDGPAEGSLFGAVDGRVEPPEGGDETWLESPKSDSETTSCCCKTTKSLVVLVTAAVMCKYQDPLGGVCCVCEGRERECKDVACN